MCLFINMTDLDIKIDEGVPPELSNPADEMSKAEIDDILNKKIDDEELVLPPEPEPAPLIIKEVIEEEVFKDVKPIREKRKATKKQLEHLARAREKANATRKANKIKRDEAKLNKYKNGQPINDLKITQTKPENEIKKEYPTFKQFTDDDIKKLQEDAISSYEVKRKARKQKKKEEQAVQVKKQKDFNAVSKAVSFNNIAPADDPWSLCFN